MDQQKHDADDSSSIWGIPSCPKGDNWDEKMWGVNGVPPLVEDAEQDTENIASLLPPVPLLFSQGEDHQQEQAAVIEESAESNDENDDVIMSAICWKLRSGLGKFSVTKSHWERRRLVLQGTKLLYYKLTQEEVEEDKRLNKRKPSNSDLELSTTSENDNANNNKSTSTTTPPASPQNDRRTWSKFLSSSTSSPVKAQAEEKPEGPRDVLDIVAANATVGQACTPGAPTAYEVDILIKGEVKWKFCFTSPEEGSKWLSALEHVVMDDSREHGFVAGDHIIRWDMIFLPPVIWPIQIHGIVLDAGRNCVIIADFGLTSYAKQGGNSKDLATLDDKEGDKDVTDAYHTLFPKKKRLNVVVLTDPREIRQWSKVNYGHHFEMTPNKRSSKAFDKMTFGLFRKSSMDDADDKEEGLDAKTELEEALQHIASVEEKDGTIPSAQEERRKTNGSNKQIEEDNSQLQLLAENATSSEYLSRIEEDGQLLANNKTAASSLEERKDEVEEDCSGNRRRRKSESEASLYLALQNKDIPQAPPVFSLPPPPPTSQEDYKKLPKSDPTKIVLARTNFVLENEEFLPPYHVLFSNSECIAVWCKTGRWSTLQTAVWCHVTAVGNAKTSTGIALGVAAAHLFLVPIAAVGGLMFVAAPLYIYRKSKEKWEEATTQLTEKFWERAEPEVFVEAIEHWSGLKKKKRRTPTA